RSTERRSKYGSHAGANASDHQDPSLARRHAQNPADGGSEGGPDLHGRSFAPAGTSCAEGQNRRERFDPDDTPSNHAALMVKHVNHLVAAPAAGLRSKAADESTSERTHRRQDQQKPRPKLQR